MNKNSNFIDYLKEYQSININIGAEDAGQFKRLKIAVLSSSTVKGLKEVLFVKCYNLGIIPEILMGEYNQYNQEILDNNSRLYNFKPDLIFLFIDAKSLLGDAFFNYIQLPEEKKNNLFSENIEKLKSLLNKLAHNLTGKIVLHNFEVPAYSPLGIIESKQRLGQIEFIKKINFEINNYFKDNSQIFIFDYDLFCSKWGKENIVDFKLYYMGDIKINFKYFPELCDEYLSYIKPLSSLTKKCIVLDLDNTLWGGIIGEDGLAGIKLGPTPEGRPFLEFQKYILSLFNRGVILAINSKNNLEDALNVLRNHPGEILKEKHFASIRINWEDKISNMKAIAEEINIGLDSLVFLDDDELSREMIKSALPEVKVVDLPKDPALYLKTLMELNDFNSFHFSKEDKERGRMYADQRKRQEFSRTVTDITEYLKALKMRVTIERANSFNTPRIAQLTQKTNQFNMTARRYSEEDVRKFSANDNFLIFSVAVEDKFGDNGITGAAIIKKQGAEWIIDLFLLSCRIIGRRVEETILAFILEEAKKAKAKILIGEFIPTKKNTPAKGFYEKNSFELIEENGEAQKWKYSVNKGYEYPEFIKLIKK